MLTLAEFQTNAYTVNRNHAKVTEIVYHDTHSRERAANYFGHAISNSQYPNVKSIDITAGTDTVYLPYYQDRVASVKLPTTGPSRFFTDNMSGCAFYLGQKNDGTLVAFHANSQAGSSEAELANKPPSFQSEKAARQLDTLVRTASNDYSGGVKILCVLSKTRYLAKINARASTASKFIGGTTIAGFRTGTNWEFWFQNFGSTSGSAVGLIHVEKFFG